MEKDIAQMTKYEYNGISVLVDEFAEPWMTQKQMAELLGITGEGVISLLSFAIKNGDLDEEKSTTKLPLVVDGKRTYQVKHYDLNAILLVGFRSKATRQAIAFREWIAGIVREYLGLSQNEKIKMQQEIIENQQKIIAVLQKNHADSQQVLNEIQEKILLANLAYASEEMRIDVLQGQLQKLADQTTNQKYQLRLSPKS